MSARMTPAEVSAYVERHALEEHVSAALNAAVRVAHPQPLSCIADALDGVVSVGSGGAPQTHMAARAYVLYYKLQTHLGRAIEDCVRQAHAQPLACIAAALRCAEADPPVADDRASGSCCQTQPPASPTPSENEQAADNAFLSAFVDAGPSSPGGSPPREVTFADGGFPVKLSPSEDHSEVLKLNT